MRDIIVTNNPLVRGNHTVSFVEGGLLGVLTAARDLIHLGHRLLTHPLSGSVKPGETPYKTVILSKTAGPGADAQSLEIIENAVITASKFRVKTYPDEILRDFQLIDYTLIFGEYKENGR